MTGRAVRDVGFLAWRDERAWMESMSGDKWKARIRSENQRFDAAVRAVARDEGTDAVEAALSAFQAASEESDVGGEMTLGSGVHKIRVKPRGPNYHLWDWVAAGEDAEFGHPPAGDLDTDAGSTGIVAYTHDVGKGAESYELVVQQRERRLWRGSKRGGPTVAILGHRIFFLEEESPLRYSRLISLDLATGKGSQLLYEETDRRCGLTLFRGERRCLFLLSENAGRQRLFHVQENGSVRQLSPEGICFVPIGYTGAGAKEPCYLVRRGSFAAPWEACGSATFRAWKLSGPLLHHGIDAVFLTKGILISRFQGIRSLWACSTRTAPRLIQHTLGEFSWDWLTRWTSGLGGAQKEGVPMQMHVPGRSPVGVHVTREGVRVVRAALSVYGRPIHGQLELGAGAGRGAAWCLVQPVGRAARGLLVMVYGAYGIPTHLNTERWKPYLQRGWAVGIAFVRGGGDSNELWAEAGRLAGKELAVDEFVGCVRSMQEILGFGPSQTCVMGRSAGGYMVGAATARCWRRDVFGAVYCEVPYVDVLRTASNPALPLTEFELLEFGDPARKIADFETILRLAPIEGLESHGAPGVFVVCRTALNDKQVLAYEAVKWITALRGGGKAEPKLVRISGGEGHFARGNQLFVERAEDFLLLDDWLKSAEKGEVRRR